jgi:hypothetical protein
MEVIYPNPAEAGMEISCLYEVRVDGRPVPVYTTATCHYAVVVINGEATADITVRRPFSQAIVRPLSAGKVPQTAEGGLRLPVCPTDKLSVELDGDTTAPLLLLCSAPIPRPEGVTHYFEGGRVHNVGQLVLQSADTVYIDEGAIVIGQILAEGAKDITVCGNGILCGTKLHEHKEQLVGTRCMFRAIECRNVHLCGLTVVDGPGWHIVPVACDGVKTENLNILSVVFTGDGIDVVGSEHVRIEGCFFQTNDDCVVLKGNRYDDPRGCKNVADVVCRRCVMWKTRGGNALEIGYETSCTEICRVLFEDIDIIHCEREGHMSGGVFTIHNGDRAHVHDIVYRNIRVEDAREKFIDFKIIDSRYSVDKQRGLISDILFEDIAVLCSPLPPSILRGHDGDFTKSYPVSRVTIRNLTVAGQPVKNALDCHMIAELCQDLRFE